MKKNVYVQSPKNKIRQVTAFTCPMCQTLYPTLLEVMACCRCHKCRTPYGQKGYSSLCGHCGYGRDLREARKEVHRHGERLKSAENRLKMLLSAKRPPKGGAPL